MTSSKEQANKAEVSKLYRVCVDCVRRLERAVDKKSVSQVFAADQLALREKLRDACEKLWFLDAQQFGRKAEDQIWRKCFYEPVQLIRSNKSTLTEKQRVWGGLLLSAAAGYYHGLFLKIDAAGDEGANDWRAPAKYRIMICLGDLSRYHIDLSGDADEDLFRLAETYYLKAFQLSRGNGMAFNQLGTLFAHKLFGLDATYYYMRSLLSDQLFDGVDGNLKLVFARNAADYKSLQSDERPAENEPTGDERVETVVRAAAVVFVRLVALLYENRSDKGSELGHLWRDAVDRMHALLQLDSAAAAPVCLKMAAVTQLIIKYLQSHSAAPPSVAVSFLLSSFAVVVDALNRRLEAPLDDDRRNNNDSASACALDHRACAEVDDAPPPVAAEVPTPRRAVGRRRRRASADDDASECGSDQASAEEESEGEEDVVAVTDSDASDCDAPPADSAPTANGVAAVSQSDLTSPPSVLPLIDDNLLAVLKVYCDWFRCNPELVASMGKELQQLWFGVTNLMNALLDRQPDGAEQLHCWRQQLPLPEDMCLRSLPTLQQAHATLKWDEPLNPADYETNRALSVLTFGGFLLGLNLAGLALIGGRFAIVDCAPSTNGTAPPPMADAPVDRRVDVMRVMAKRRAEEEMQQLKRVGWIPVYVVPDTHALVNALGAVKKLAAAQRFVVVVAHSVVRDLDRLKKESVAARDAIRWLELAIAHGSKYVRAQKHVDAAGDKAAVDGVTSEVRELMACCASLSGTVASNDGGTTVVTLVSSHPPASLPLRALVDGTRKLSVAGTVVENVHRFLRRWQEYAKKYG